MIKSQRASEINKSGSTGEPGGKRHKTSRGDNYHKFYLLFLLLFDRISIIFSQDFVVGVWRFGFMALGFWGVVGGCCIHTLIINL